MSKHLSSSGTGIWQRHRSVIVILLFLSIIAAAARFLGAQLVPTPSFFGGQTSSADTDELR